MRENFDYILKLLLVHEGGFSTDENDPGNRLPDGRKGSTMLGITQANWEDWVGHPVTWDDMKALTPDNVGMFYHRKYWDAVHGDSLPSGVDYIAFDFAVNAGPTASIKLLQKALSVLPDGVIGPKTISAIATADRDTLIERFADGKEAFYRSLSNFPIYGKGWLTRAAEVKNVAETM